MTQQEKEARLIQAILNLPPDKLDFVWGVLVGATLPAKHPEEAQA